MSTRQLSEAITGGAIRSVNFFNGRLLSAEDLNLEQAARRQADALLGKALGEGIAFGLEVRQTASAGSLPQVNIQAGLAINRRGQAVALADPVDLSLVQPSAAATVPAAAFRDCKPTQPGVYVTGAGVYLLVMSPAAATEGRAPANGLGNTTPSCGARYKIDAVTFRLISVNAGTLLGQPAMLRNLLAYQCYGHSDLPRFQPPASALPWQRIRLLELLRADNIGLTDCDVPLGFLYWTAAGIQFVDMWSVRRRVTHPVGSSDGPPYDDRHASEAEAMIEQFDDQLAAILAVELRPATVVASSQFRYLPPAGILPTGAGGFAYEVFFQGQSYHSPVFVQSGRVEPLIRSALNYGPIDLGQQEAFWIYQVMRGTAVLPYLVFTNIYVPFQGEARFDIASWDQSNMT
jgi:hypothetical protein